MCYAEDSVEYQTATCKMCAVTKLVYQKSRTACPHVQAMGICQSRENHPRGANIIHYRNAEINTFNGCGYCKWAERHPDGTQRDRLSNPGWPGCCRPPSAQDYQLYIDKADWPAVSSIFKLSHVASSNEGHKGSTPQTSRDSSSSPSMREEPCIKLRSSPTAKPMTTWPVPRSHSPNSRVQPPRVATDPVPRSSSPLAFGNGKRERPSTPPIVATASKDAQAQARSNKGTGTPTHYKNSSSGSPDEPTTPPARQHNELASTRQRLAPQSDIVTVERSSFVVPRETPDASTPRRTTIAIQNQSAFYPREDATLSLRNRASIRPNASPRSIDVPVVMPEANRNATPPAVRTPMEGMVAADRSTLSSEDLARVHALDRALQGLALTSSMPSNHLSSTSNPLNHSTSSSSSDSSDGSATSVGSYSIDDGGSSTAGGSSDFTDFLSDDSDYELQRQAEIRAEILHRQRLDRVEEKEFRDAQQSIAAFGLSDTMTLQGLTHGTVGRGSAMRHARAKGPSVNHSLHLPQQYHAVVVDRYR
ncbi:uncharacterized protein EI90DRAFT_3039842 [Cantharellus anzutake]|uniref:uncharacterized protein n=1 Tax=Cantharellus anzutake TaxID=1750568 RepID=UPI0019063273|nr:uncharacterized protein EI90DRAFT_3039842 [Cantharellus anzutake]KAF8338965.1 hypothetical protein EI90DRAFT_3039842 [Cantharellus anzutake]